MTAPTAPAAPTAPVASAAPAAPAAPGFNMRRIGRHTLVYGAGMLLSKAVSFIMLPVYTHYLTPADYGVMELIGMSLDLIAIVAGARLALGIFRFYHKAETEADRKRVVSTALVALGISYAFVGLLAMLGAPWLSTAVFGSARHAHLIRLAAASLALQSLTLVPLSYARVKDRSMLFVGANIVRLVIGLSLNILLLVHLGWGVEGIFWANLIASAVTGVGLGAWVIREVGLGFSPAMTRDLIRYGLPLIGTQVATFAMTFGDRYFLQALGDENIVGLYSLSYQFGFLLAMIGYIPFEQVWEPARFAIAKRADKDDVLARGFVYMNLVLITVAVGLSVYVPDLLRVMASPQFHPAATVVPVVLAAYVLQGWTQMQDIGILVREKTRYLTIANWVAAVVAIAGYAILIPRFLAMGAALATVIAFAVRYGVTLYFSQRLWPVRYRWAPVLRLVAFGVPAAAAGAALPPMDVLPSLAVRTLLVLAYLVALWTGGVLSDADRALVRRVVATRRLSLDALRA